jgi:sigma54-dependent transcription regulator
MLVLSLIVDRTREAPEKTRASRDAMATLLATLAADVDPFDREVLERALDIFDQARALGVRTTRRQ